MRSMYVHIHTYAGAGYAWGAHSRCWNQRGDESDHIVVHVTWISQSCCAGSHDRWNQTVYNVCKWLKPLLFTCAQTRARSHHVVGSVYSGRCLYINIIHNVCESQKAWTLIWTGISRMNCDVVMVVYHDARPVHLVCWPVYLPVYECCFAFHDSKENMRWYNCPAVYTYRHVGTWL